LEPDMFHANEYQGGVFSDQLDGGRASATLTVMATGVKAVTSTGQEFVVQFRECLLDLGGASGRMVFVRTPDRKLTVFCEDRRFMATLELDGGVGVAERLLALRGRRSGEDARWRMWLAVAAGTCVLCAVGGYYGVLTAAQATIHAMPVSVDNKIGSLAIESMTLDGKPVEDEVIGGAVKTILTRLEPHAGLAGLAFDVRVIDAPAVNAFCLPGGKIVVYTGLLRKAKSAEQVAGVMGHEMAHAIKRHGLRQLAKSLGVLVAIELLIGDIGGLVAMGVEFAKSAALTRYSREIETEADLVGVRLLHAAAIDPAALAEFFTLLEDEGHDAPDAVAWLSTHPQHGVRVATINDERATLGKQDYRPLAIDWGDVQLHLKRLEVQ
jgi:Zn-dependent protease with chaperone function